MLRLLRMFFHQNIQKLQTNDKRVILLIGGGGVLGRALLEKKPDDVFVINLTKKSIQESRENIATLHFDVSRHAEDAILHIASLVDCVDVLINAAVVYHRVSLEQLKEKEFIEEFILNTFVPMKLSRLCAQYFWSKYSREVNTLRARKVINISSTAAFGNDSRPTRVLYNGTKGALYAGTKAALNIMTEHLHEYVREFGVSAHVVAPHSLKRDEVCSETVQLLWELQLKDVQSFSTQKIW